MNIGGREITIKELSVAEVRAIFADHLAQHEAMVKNGAKIDVVGETICEDITLREIIACTNLDASQLEIMKLSSLIELAQAVKDANPAYLEYRARLQTIGAQAANQKLV